MNLMFERLDEFDHPFTINEHGLWCDACGELVAAPWTVDETYRPPETCPTCGWPDEFDPEKN